jgi:hypothetical protein
LAQCPKGGFVNSFFCVVKKDISKKKEKSAKKYLVHQPAYLFRAIHSPNNPSFFQFALAAETSCRNNNKKLFLADLLPDELLSLVCLGLFLTIGTTR